jgi:hypothetical protein
MFIFLFVFVNCLGYNLGDHGLEAFLSMLPETNLEKLNLPSKINSIQIDTCVQNFEVDFLFFVFFLRKWDNRYGLKYLINSFTKNKH